VALDVEDLKIIFATLDVLINGKVKSVNVEAEKIVTVIENATVQKDVNGVIEIVTEKKNEKEVAHQGTEKTETETAKDDETVTEAIETKTENEVIVETVTKIETEKEAIVTEIGVTVKNVIAVRVATAEEIAMRDEKKNMAEMHHLQVMVRRTITITSFRTDRQKMGKLNRRKLNRIITTLPINELKKAMMIIINRNLTANNVIAVYAVIILPWWQR